MLPHTAGALLGSDLLFFLPIEIPVLVFIFAVLVAAAGPMRGAIQRHTVVPMVVPTGALLAGADRRSPPLTR
jgi:hypothetical protein